MKKKIRCWKVAKENVALKDALTMFKNRAIQGTFYNDIALRFGHRVFQWGVDNIDNESFSIQEMLNNTWEVLVPDDGMEEMTDNCRSILKESHYLGERFQKIDNMNINEMFTALFSRLNLISDRAKYRLIKKIIEDKLYKE